jgi:hypothetical protein
MPGVARASWAARREALTSEAGLKPWPSLIMPGLRGAGVGAPGCGGIAGEGGGGAALGDWGRCWRCAMRDAGAGVRDILPALAVAVEVGPMGAARAGAGAGDGVPGDMTMEPASTAWAARAAWPSLIMPGAAGETGAWGAGDAMGAGETGGMTMEPALRPGMSMLAGRGAAAGAVEPVMLPASSMLRPCWAVPALKVFRLASKEPSARAVRILSRRVGAAPGEAWTGDAWRVAMRWEKSSGLSSALRTPPFLMVGREAMEPGAGGVKAMVVLGWKG